MTGVFTWQGMRWSLGLRLEYAACFDSNNIHWPEISGGLLRFIASIS
jgi:hypothetical protein